MRCLILQLTYAYHGQFIMYRRVKQRRFDVDQDGTQFVKFGFVWLALTFVLCKYAVCVLLCTLLKVSCTSKEKDVYVHREQVGRERERERVLKLYIFTYLFKNEISSIVSFACCFCLILTTPATICFFHFTVMLYRVVTLFQNNNDLIWELESVWQSE